MFNLCTISPVSPTAHILFYDLQTCVQCAITGAELRDEGKFTLLIHTMYVLPYKALKINKPLLVCVDLKDCTMPKERRLT